MKSKTNPSRKKGPNCHMCSLVEEWLWNKQGVGEPAGTIRAKGVGPDLVSDKSKYKGVYQKKQTDP